MGPPEYQADPGGQAPRGSEESQGPPASRQASEALKETRGSLGSLEVLATWATQGPAVPRGSLVPQD